MQAKALLFLTPLQKDIQCHPDTSCSLTEDSAAAAGGLVTLLAAAAEPSDGLRRRLPSRMNDVWLLLSLMNLSVGAVGTLPAISGNCKNNSICFWGHLPNK